MPHPTHAASGPAGGRTDYSSAPFLVIWETTRACDLACRHCRADAQPERDAGELSTAEAKRMLEEVRRFGPLIVVLSGGDSMKRPDIVELVRHGASLGLRMAITPATTPLATRDQLLALRDAGLARVAVSLDGATAASHDAFRRVDGSFEHGLRVLRTARELGLSTQVNTVVAQHDLDELPALAALLGELGIVFWEVFFLIPMGRARAEDVASAAEFEAAFHRLYDLSAEAPFDIKATAAPQYNRVVLERKAAERRAGLRGEAVDVLTDGAVHSLRDGIGRARGVNDGDGILFVSHRGEIFPSGFLPIVAGNVRDDDLVRVYREAPIFLALRDRGRVKGKCGVCAYLPACGGSRARAYAMTGDPLEAEPFCAYVPPRWAAAVEAGEAEPVEAYFARRNRWVASLPVLVEVPAQM